MTIRSPVDRAAITYAIQTGKELIDKHPWLASAFREGAYIPELIYDHRLGGILKKVEEGTARATVAIALRGYKGEYENSFEGLMPLEEYKSIVKQHYVNRNKSLKERRGGIHGFSPEKIRQTSIDAVIARGIIPWTEEEKRELYSLSLEERFREKGHIAHWAEIAKLINEKYHNGEEVRTEATVASYLYSYRRRNTPNPIPKAS